MAQFDGDTYDDEQDAERLGRQLDRVRQVMSDGQWRSLKQLAKETGSPEASVSARLRDLRKDKHGGLLVTSRRKAEDEGTWEYCLGTNSNLAPMPARMPRPSKKRLYRKALAEVADWLDTNAQPKAATSVRNRISEIDGL
jgi:hypothetical protein